MKNLIRFTIVFMTLVVASCSTLPNTTDFFELVKTGNPEQISRALKARTNVNAPNKVGWTPLMFALNCNRNSEVINVLLKAGANVKTRSPSGSWTPLLLAAMHNQSLSTFMILVKAGALINEQGPDGETALILAAANNNPEVVAILIDAGANTEVQDNEGLTSLMVAAKYTKNSEVVTTLLKAGADEKVKDKLGKTAYDYAMGNPKLVGTDALELLKEAQR
jgi:ankyrin repeat protein